MAAPTPEELAEVEARLRSILEPYAGRLETASIYNIPTLRRPGAKAHDWFAFVKPAARHVSLFLLPIHADAELAASLSPGLAKRRTGASVFTFAAVDEALFAELAAVVARAYELYVAPGG